MEHSFLESFSLLGGVVLVRFSKFDFYIWSSRYGGRWQTSVTERIDSSDFLSQLDWSEKITFEINAISSFKVAFGVNDDLTLTIGAQIFNLILPSHENGGMVQLKGSNIFISTKNESDINAHIGRYHHLRINTFTSLGTGLFIWHMDNATMQLFFDETGWNLIMGEEMDVSPEEEEHDIFRDDYARIQKIDYSDLFLFNRDIIARGNIRVRTLDRKGRPYTTPPITITIRPFDHYGKDIINQESYQLTGPILESN